MAKSAKCDFHVGPIGVVCDVSVWDSWPPVWFFVARGAGEKVYLPFGLTVTRERASRSLLVDLVLGPVVFGIGICLIPRNPDENSNGR